jgi:hypothetical protein
LFIFLFWKEQNKRQKKDIFNNALVYVFVKIKMCTRDDTHSSLDNKWVNLLLNMWDHIKLTCSPTNSIINLKKRWIRYIYKWCMCI